MQKPPQKVGKIAAMQKLGPPGVARQYASEKAKIKAAAARAWKRAKKGRGK